MCFLANWFKRSLTCSNISTAINDCTVKCGKTAKSLYIKPCDIQGLTYFATFIYIILSKLVVVNSSNVISLWASKQNTYTSTIALGDQVLSSLKQFFKMGNLTRFSLTCLIGTSTVRDSSQGDHPDAEGSRSAGTLLGTTCNCMSGLSTVNCEACWDFGTISVKSFKS